MELRFWKDPETDLPHIYDHGLRSHRQSETSLSQAAEEKKEMTKKMKQKYPAGWNEERVRKLAEHYDNQTEDEQVAEHEAAMMRQDRRSWSSPPNWFPRLRN
jgi:hypothetical protein